MTDQIQGISAEAARVEEDALYSSRGHFAAARGWAKVHYWIGIPATVLAAAAGGSGFADRPILAGIFSIATAVLSALAVFLNPQGKSVQHHSAGTSFNAIRNQARVFRHLEAPILQPEGALARLKDLGEQRDNLNGASPPIPEWAFRRAQRSIASGEATHATDAPKQVK